MTHAYLLQVPTAPGGNYHDRSMVFCVLLAASPEEAAKEMGGTLSEERFIGADLHEVKPGSNTAAFLSSRLGLEKVDIIRLMNTKFYLVGTTVVPVGVTIA